MKLIAFSLSFLICGAALTRAEEPNYVRSIVYKVDGEHDVQSTSYTDGLGRVLQSKLSLNGVEDRVVSTFYDDLGRQSIVTKPYIDNTSCGRFFPGNLASVKAKLETEYASYGPADAQYAYSESDYYDDPTGRMKSSGLPGSQNRLGADRESRNWYFGIVREPSSIGPVELTRGEITFQNGFIAGITEYSGYDTADVLDELTEFMLDIPPTIFATELTHFLTVTRDAGRQLTQVLKDQFGRVVSNWADPSSDPGDEIISSYRYDILGNKIEEIAPNSTNPISNSTYQYNTIGQLIRKRTPDGAIETMEYDDAGNIASLKKYHKNPTTMVEKLEQHTRYYYDEFSRLCTVVGLPTVPGSGASEIVFVENYYDCTNELNDKAELYGIPEGTLGQLKNLKGRVVANVAHNRINNKVSYIVDLFSYNNRGGIEKKFKIVPGLAVQEIEFAYDLHGKKTTEKIICGSKVVEKKYNYDELGRLIEILHANNSNKQLARYSFDKYGAIINKNLLGKQDITFQYSILDQLKTASTTSPQGFNEEIAYLPDGNIGSANFEYKNETTSSQIRNTYTYDNTGRLKAVAAEDRNLDPLPAYNANYGYDQIGRFKWKDEGSVSNLYTYYQNTNRLQKPGTKPGEYIYDYNGSMVVDRFKKLIIEYDWRGLPVHFRFYSSIPSAVSSDTYGTVMVDGIYCSDELYRYMKNASTNNPECRLLSIITMYYDASGNRVMKTESVN